MTGCLSLARIRHVRRSLRAISRGSFACRFLGLPPIHVSSTWTAPPSRSERLSLHGLTDAVEHVPCRLGGQLVLALISRALTPFFDEHISKMTKIHVWMLIFVPWKIVPVSTENCLRQCRTPRRGVGRLTRCASCDRRAVFRVDEVAPVHAAALRAGVRCATPAKSSSSL